MSLLRSLAKGGWLRTVDDALANSMQRTRPETPDLVLAAAALTSRALANGHSQLPLAQTGELLTEIIADRELPGLPPLDEWMAVLRASPWIATSGQDLAGRVLVLEGNALSLSRYWRYEMRLAAAVSARLTSVIHHDDVGPTDARIAQLFAAADGSVDQAQIDAARATLAGNFLLLTGGPGTGKTTTVARTLVLFAEQFSRLHDNAIPRIELAAPTGKAAARLAESVRDNLAQLLARKVIDVELARTLPSEAKTLHRLLGWQRGTIDFRHGSDRPLAADLVIVDEASMIDLPLMCKLIEAIPATATLLLIGDRDQLPSVETGDVLAALSSALATNRAQLNRSHRQADDVDVAALAGHVREGDVSAALHGLQNGEFRGVHWQRGNDRALSDAVLAQALPAYRDVQNASDVSAALAAARGFRVLTAVREGGAGSQTLNALIAGNLDPSRRGDGFFHGRLVLISENSYRHQLFNGDIGVVWADEFGELRVWFDAPGGPRAWLPAALPAHESAFALTVHKSQGSEFENVFLALPEHGARVVSRELIYTGLTRCRRTVTLWASETVLAEGISRRAQRWSGLAARIQAP